MECEKKLVNYKSSIAGLLSGGIFTFASWKTFVKGVFSSFAADYNLYDGALIVGFAAMLFALILVVKDMVDGRKFTSGEKRKAMKAIGIMGLLFAGGWVTANYFAASVNLVPVTTNADGTAGDFMTTNGIKYTGGSQTLLLDVTLSANTPYVVGAAANDTDYTDMYLYFNQSYITWSAIKLFRGFNSTFSDDGITYVGLVYYDQGGSATVLLDSTDDTTQVDLTDLGTTTGINMTWSLADVLVWQATYVFDDPGDRIMLSLDISSDYTETTALTVNWYWSKTGSDLTYIIVVGLWCAAGLVPLALMLDLFNKKTYRRKSYKSYNRR